MDFLHSVPMARVALQKPEEVFGLLLFLHTKKENTVPALAHCGAVHRIEVDTDGRHRIIWWSEDASCATQEFSTLCDDFLPQGYGFGLLYI